MKNRLTSHLGFVAMAFLVATAITATADVQDLTKAKVIRIKGSARFTTGTGTWQPLKVGDVLTSGTVIQTAADSRVDLVLGDPKAIASDMRVALPIGSASPGGAGTGGSSAVTQNFLRMLENTVLSVDKLAATDTGAEIVTDTQLDLRAGKIFGTVKKLSAGSRYEVKVPNGVAGIRGTVFVLSALGQCWVSSGAVTMVMTDAADKVHKWTVNGGFMLEPRDGENGQLIPLTKSDDDQMIINLSAAQNVRQGSNPWGPVPPNGKDNPHVSPTEGVTGPPPGVTPGPPSP